MSAVAEGRAPTESTKREREYLLKKLEEIRKDCQWLLGLAAASVLGVVLKDNFGAATPSLRTTALIMSASQILISMVGAMSWWTPSIDPASEITFLTTRLRTRYLLRNGSIVLLAASFILIAAMGWKMLPPSR